MTRVILGEAPPELPPQVAGESATETVWQVAMQQSRYWKNVDPKACEPQEGEQHDTIVHLFRLTIFSELEPMAFSIPGDFEYLLPRPSDETFDLYYCQKFSRRIDSIICTLNMT